MRPVVVGRAVDFGGVAEGCCDDNDDDAGFLRRSLRTWVITRGFQSAISGTPL
jgi:hypothetical protein